LLVPSCSLGKARDKKGSAFGHAGAGWNKEPVPVSCSGSDGPSRVPTEVAFVPRQFECVNQKCDLGSAKSEECQ